MNIFATFDPVGPLGLPVNWLVIFLLMPMLPNSFWPLYPQPTFCIKYVFFQIMNEIKAPMYAFSSPGSILVSLGFFSILLMNNLLSLMPYVFTPSSHLSYSFSIALPLWLGYMVAYSNTNLPLMLAHLVPQGTPTPLLPLMVFIEVVSTVIRPITLSVRLAANMVAGHLILSLVSEKLPKSPALTFIPFFILTLMMVFLEMFVAFIQAYVFSVLSTLYLSEANFPNSQIYN